MGNRFFLIGKVPDWLESFIAQNDIIICDNEPDMVLILEKVPNLRETISQYQTMYIPIVSETEIDWLNGAIYLPSNRKPEFLGALLQTLTLERERNPLTHLPGNEAIRREIERKIFNHQDYILAYVDMNNFKIYNDRYGFAMGDQLIVSLAQIIRDCIGDNFLGHIGGDDFVFIIRKNEVEILNKICHQFDQSLKFFYPEVDWQRHWIRGIDRKGKENRFGFVHTAIALLENSYRNFSELNYAVAYLKKVSKERSKNEEHSLWVSDQEVHIWRQEALRKILNSPDRVARRTAIEVLGELAEEENLDLFINLLRDQDFLIRKSVVYSLGKMGKKEVVPYLLSALNDPSPHVRMRVAEALGHLYDNRIPGALLSALNDPNEYVKSAAIKSIGELRLKSAVPLLVRMREERIVPHILATLGVVGDEAGIDFIKDKLRNPKSTKFAIEALGRINSERSLLILLELIAERGLENHRRIILKAIYNLRKLSQFKETIREHRDRLIKEMDKRKPYYEMMILYQIGDREFNGAFKKFIGDRQEFMRRAAILYLSSDKRNLNSIGNALINDPSPFIRQTAAGVLVKFGNYALTYLRKALKDNDFQVRQTSARSIMQILFHNDPE